MRTASCWCATRPGSGTSTTAPSAPRVYDAEIAELVAALSGAVRVLVFDHTLRHGDEAVQRAKGLREPVEIIHNDYTDWSGPERVRDLLPGEARALLERRFAIIQVWRPMQPVVLRHPLAVCEARTIAPADLIPTERRHPHRIGEIYHLAYSSAHRWHYVPALRRDEAIVFKTYDSATDGRARFTAHAAFRRSGDAPRRAAPREHRGARPGVLRPPVAAGARPARPASPPRALTRRCARGAFYASGPSVNGRPPAPAPARAR